MIAFVSVAVGATENLFLLVNLKSKKLISLRNAGMADRLCVRLQTGIGGFDSLSQLLRGV